MPGAGNTQIINGQTYTMYSPQWYAAMQAETQRQAAAEGTAAGTKVAAANTAAGLPPLSSSVVPNVTGVPGAAGAPGASGSPAAVPAPSLTGLEAALPGRAGVSGASGTSGTASGGTATSSGGYQQLAPVDTSAAQRADFATAKDQVGQEATGALTGLRSALASRGLLGSGLEERGTAAAATGAAGQLGDVSRQQAVTAADLANTNATTNLNAGVTQRGQDIQKEEAANTLGGQLAIAGQQGAITQREQDINNANTQKTLALEQASLGMQQRSSALAGLEAALNINNPSTSASGTLY